MLNPSLALQEAGYMGVYVNTKTYGTGSPNSSMTAPRAVSSFMIGDQEVGFVATLLCGSTSLKRQDYLRISYGPEYASELAAATTEYFETRDPKLANLKAGGCLPPVLRKAKRMKEAIEVANRRATRVAKEAARKAAKAPSKRALPERQDPRPWHAQASALAVSCLSPSRLNRLYNKLSRLNCCFTLA
jgi:hypothetical protein